MFIKKIKGLFMDKQVQTIVEKLREVHEKVDAPNSGGCGIIAYTAYTAYKKENPRRKASIVFMFHKYADQARIDKINNGEATSPGHAIVKLGRRYFDSCREWKSLKDVQKNNIQYELIEIPAELCLKTINESRWNRIFDRQTEVPKINKIFGTDHQYVA